MPGLKLSIRELLLLIVVLTSGWAQVAWAQTKEPVMLVASPQMRGLYAHTVLVAVPVGHDRHLGFIINRPTERSLASLFPEHAPSKQVKSPVYLGGPENVSTVFAVVPEKELPNPTAFPFLPGLSVVADAKTIDAIIEQAPNAARYYVGFVAWKPGELTQELEKGYWQVMEPEAGMVFRERPESMWEELVKVARSPDTRI
jgi:putative transcriptional regulator